MVLVCALSRRKTAKFPVKADSKNQRCHGQKKVNGDIMDGRSDRSRFHSPKVGGRLYPDREPNCDKSSTKIQSRSQRTHTKAFEVNHGFTSPQFSHPLRLIRSKSAPAPSTFQAIRLDGCTACVVSGGSGWQSAKSDDEKRDAVKDRREEIAQTRYTRIARMRRQTAAGE
jgi:hypothetical protein